MSKPPKIVIPGLNRGAGIPPGHIMGRRRTSGRGPAELLDLPQLQAVGLATGAQVAQTVASLSTAISAATGNSSSSQGPPGFDMGDAGCDNGMPNPEIGLNQKANLNGGNSFLGGQTFAGPLVQRSAPGGHFTQIQQFATVGGANYGFSENVLGLTNPLAPSPDQFLYSFGAEGVFTAGGTVTSYDFYIFDDITFAYRLYADGLGNVQLGGTDALHSPGLAIDPAGNVTIAGIGYVGVNKIYHAGNLSFGTGLSYNAGTGVLTASGGGGSTGGLMWAGMDGADGDDGMPLPGPPGSPGGAGSAGPAGPQGPIGLDGRDGDDGVSIFGPGDEPLTAANATTRRSILSVYSIAEVKTIITPFELSPTKPAAADFTLLNGAAGTNGATLADYERGVSILQNGTPGATGQIRFARHNTVSVGQAFTMTARLGSMDPSQAYGQAQQAALILRNSANGRMILFGNGSSDVTGFVQIFSSYTSGQLGQYTAFSVMYQFPWKRIVSDGTNLTFFVSKDGYYWVPGAAGTTIANYITVLDEAGIGVQSIPAVTTPHGTVCQSFTFA